jgi:hypothetical protein
MATEPLVQTSIRLFSEEVALADAGDPEAQRNPVVYEFAGGRRLYRDPDTYPIKADE